LQTLTYDYNITHINEDSNITNNNGRL
jgi:hypothetical protein